MTQESSAAELQAYLHEQIPVSRLMEISVVECGTDRLVLSAPLGPNHNHLGTAFGGSLATIATLAGYGALWTALGDRDAHVVVKKSEIEYLRPVKNDILATCRLPEGGVGESFCRVFQAKGKARMILDVSIGEGGNECVRFRGEFVAVRSLENGS
ncbi:YiiD C-terminal domain-containing protein [Haloferula sp.]|uniref:YiiD C-terminal domain-containing protein n=1 Tax=Haloferula sp. TaxID=2497595 RepID=UPI00329D5B3F